MDKSIRNGYFRIKRGEGEGRFLHFSMNCWSELEQDTGMGILNWTKEFYKKKTLNSKAEHMAHLVFAAAKAYDLEEGNKIDYNIFKVKNWVGTFKEEDAMEFLEALGWAANPNTGIDLKEGKE